jgi:hypothetical protein
MTLTLDYITDKNGRKKAVQIPISDWKRFLKEHQRLMEYSRLKQDLSEAILEINLIESGKKKARTLNQFLDAL